MAEIKDLKVYVLTTVKNSRLIDGKLATYPSDLPEYKIFYGPDADTLVVPKWFKDICTLNNNHRLQRYYSILLGHLSILKYHYMHHPESYLLLLEDDAVFEPDFYTYYLNFLNKVPDDWDIITFGGYPNTKFKNPNKSNYIEIKPDILKVNKFYGSECILIKPDLVKVLVDHYTNEETRKYNYVIDVTLSFLSRTKHINIYKPIYNFVFQKDGKSNIQEKYRKHSSMRNILYTDINGNLVANSSNDLMRYK